MKSVNKLITLLSCLFLVSGCTFKGDSSFSSEVISESEFLSETSIESEETSLEESSEEETTSTESESEEEQDNTRVTSISLSDKELILEINKRSQSILVNYQPNIELTDEEKEVTWRSLDEEVASIDQYGRVTGHKKGSTVVEAETVLGHYRARCNIYVVESIQDIEYQYERVDDLSILKPGNIIVLGCPESGVVASINCVEASLTPLTATYNSDKSVISSYQEGTGEFMIDGDRYGWTLESQEGQYLAAFNLGRVRFVNNKGNIKWTFCFDEDVFYMESTADVQGWMMYNERAQKFTLYDSSPQVDMFPVTLYVKTITNL